MLVLLTAGIITVACISGYSCADGSPDSSRMDRFMKLRVGLIGLGDFWHQRHAPALRMLSDRFELRAVCDQVAHRAHQVAAEFGAAAVDGFRVLDPARGRGRRSGLGPAVVWRPAGPGCLRGRQGRLLRGRHGSQRRRRGADQRPGRRGGHCLHGRIPAALRPGHVAAERTDCHAAGQSATALLPPAVGCRHARQPVDRTAGRVPRAAASSSSWSIGAATSWIARPPGSRASCIPAPASKAKKTIR